MEGENGKHTVVGRACRHGRFLAHGRNIRRYRRQSEGMVEQVKPYAELCAAHTETVAQEAVEGIVRLRIIATELSAGALALLYTAGVYPADLGYRLSDTIGQWCECQGSPLVARAWNLTSCLPEGSVAKDFSTDALWNVQQAIDGKDIEWLRRAADRVARLTEWFADQREGYLPRLPVEIGEPAHGHRTVERYIRMYGTQGLPWIDACEFTERLRGIDVLIEEEDGE